MSKANKIKHLILGGARSGKSRYAETTAIQYAQQHGLPLTYIATATADDAEMKQRIQRHQTDRDDAWATVETPLQLATTLDSVSQESVILIDCLTLWLSNCLHTPNEPWQAQKNAFIDSLTHSKHSIFMVSNEVGQGIIPIGTLTRRYVDEIGWLHQDLAKLCSDVTMVIAGLPQKLK